MRIGIIGYGFVAKMHIGGYSILKGGKLVAGCDIRENNRKELRDAMPGINVYKSIEEMFDREDLDMVDICLPTFLHRMAVEKAAKRGLHVLCEKPMALDTRECSAMISVARKNRVKLMVAQVLRFWPEYVKAKEILDSGKLGKIQFVSAQRMVSWPVWDWRHWLHDPKKSGSAALDLHIHDLDFFQWILGKPEGISAASIVNHRGGQCHITTTLQYKGGVVATAEGGFNVPPEFPFTMRFRILGEKGAIEYDSGKTPTIAFYRYSRTPGKGKKTLYPVVKGPDGYAREIQYFVNCIRKGITPEVITPEAAMESVRIARMAMKAADRSRR